LAREELGGPVSQTPSKISAQGEIHRSAGLKTCSPHEGLCGTQNTEPAPIRIPQKTRTPWSAVAPRPPSFKEFVSVPALPDLIGVVIRGTAALRDLLWSHACRSN
jgi:hypothetical protein